MYHWTAHTVRGCSVGRSGLIQHILTGSVCVGISLCSEVKLAAWARTGSTKHRHSAAGASNNPCNTHTHTQLCHLPRWKRWLGGRPLCGSLGGPVEGYCCYLYGKESAVCTLQYVVYVFAFVRPSVAETHTLQVFMFASGLYLKSVFVQL